MTDYTELKERLRAFPGAWEKAGKKDTDKSKHFLSVMGVDGHATLAIADLAEAADAITALEVERDALADKLAEAVEGLRWIDGEEHQGAKASHLGDHARATIAKIEGKG